MTGRRLTQIARARKGRMVDARDQDAIKVIATNAGHQLRLFAFEQTIADPRTHDGSVQRDASRASQCGV